MPLLYTHTCNCTIQPQHTNFIVLYSSECNIPGMIRLGSSICSKCTSLFLSMPVPSNPSWFRLVCLFVSYVVSCIQSHGACCCGLERGIAGLVFVVARSSNKGGHEKKSPQTSCAEPLLPLCQYVVCCVCVFSSVADWKSYQDRTSHSDMDHYINSRKLPDSFLNTPSGFRLPIQTYWLSASVGSALCCRISLLLEFLQGFSKTVSQDTAKKQGKQMSRVT